MWNTFPLVRYAFFVIQLTSAGYARVMQPLAVRHRAICWCFSNITNIKSSHTISCFTFKLSVLASVSKRVPGANGVDSFFSHWQDGVRELTWHCSGTVTCSNRSVHHACVSFLALFSNGNDNASSQLRRPSKYTILLSSLVSSKSVARRL